MILASRKHQFIVFISVKKTHHYSGEFASPYSGEADTINFQDSGLFMVILWIN